MIDTDNFDKWLMLRGEWRDAKREKNHQRIVDVCRKVIEFDKQTKSVHILLPLFYRDMGKAYLKLGNLPGAKESLIKARDGFIEERKKSLNKPDDWLKDIGIIEKRLQKILL